MAAKTQFSQDDFIAMLSNYRLGEFLGSQPMAEGTVQTNYAVQTAKGKFLLRYYENRSAGSVRFECSLVRYLSERAYPCPAPVRDRRGKYVGVFHGKPFAIFTFIEGRHLETPNEEQENQLIQKAAELQTLTRRYRPSNLQHRWNYSPALCRELAQETARKIGTADAKTKLEWLTGELSRLALPRPLPKGICHCDFHFSNILFKDGKFAALLDFDDANYTYLTYDLVSLMNPFICAFDWNTWSQFRQGENILDFRQAKTVVTAYMKHRPLSAIEKKHLFDVYKLSIFFDCIWYFERGCARDFYEKRKIDALNELGREAFYHQLFD